MTKSSTNKNFQLTDRDIKIIEYVNDYRYLQTGQIHRLCFANNSTMQSARRRLRILNRFGYLGRVEPYYQIGKPRPDTAYYIKKKGCDLLSGMGIVPKYWSKPKVKQQFLQHAIELSEFRIVLEAALEDTDIELTKFIADFEIKPQIDNSFGKHRYKLYSEIKHINKKSYVVYPDALIVLKVNDREGLYAFELDRGTESITTVIRNKIIGYNLYHKKQLFKKYGNFPGFKVLFQTNSPKRAKNIREILTDQEGENLVLITSSDQVNKDTILNKPIWMDHNHEKRNLFKWLK